MRFKKIIACLLTLSMLLSVLPLCVSAQEISGELEFPNSGFENGAVGSVPESWTVAGSASSAVVSKDEHYSGNSSLKLTRSGGTPSRGLRSSEVEIVGGTTYFVQSMIKGDATLCQMYIEYWSGTPDYTTASNRTTQIFSKVPTSDWSRLSGILKAPDDATVMTVCFYMNNSCAGTVYFDDVTAYAETESAVIARLNEDFEIADEALIWEDLSSAALTLSGVNSAYEQLYTYSLIREYNAKGEALTKADIQSCISDVNGNIQGIQTEILENFADALDKNIVISAKGVVNVPADAFSGMSDMGGSAKWTDVSDNGAEYFTLTESSLILDKRPSYSSDDAAAALTLTLSKNGASFNVTYNVIIKKYESEAEEALETLGFDTIKGQNTSPMRVTSNLELPETIGGMTVIWNSSNVDVIAIDGTVTRPESTTEYVKFTASVGENVVVIDLAVLPENDETKALYVENADFEETDADGLPVGWQNINGKIAPEGSFSVDSTVKFSGKSSLKINGNGTKMLGVYSSGTFGITQGNTYRASAFVYSDSDVTPQMYLKFYNIYSLELASYTATMTGNKGEWNEISAEGIAPAGAVMARLIPFASTGKSGSFYTDCVSLSELPLISKNGWTEDNGVKTSENVSAISGIEYVVTGYNGTSKDTVTLNFYAPGNVLIISHTVSADSETDLRAFCPDGASHLNVAASANVTGDIKLLPNFSGTQISDGSFESMGSTDTSAWTNAEKSETTVVKVANGDFEANTLVAETEWYSEWDSSTVCLTNEDSHSGSQSLKVSWNATSGKGGGTRSKRTAVTPGEQITFDAFYKANGKTDVYVEFWDESDNRITDTAQKLPLVQTLEAASEWTAMPQINVTVPSNAVELSIIFYCGSHGEKEDITAFFDDVRITHIPEAEDVIPWTASVYQGNPTATATITKDDKYGGNQSLHFATTRANANITSEMLPITAGTTYTISMKYKSHEGTSNLYLYVDYYDDAGNRKGYNVNTTRKIMSASAEWTSGSHTVKAPSGATKVCAILLYDGISSAYIDDITITDSNGNSLTLPNGDFENDGDEVFVDVLPWTMSTYNGNATATAEFTTEDKYSGKQSILFTTTRANANIMSEKLSATAGVTYTISMKYKSNEGSSNLYLYVDYYDDAGNRKGYNINTTRKLMPRSTEWTSGSHTVKAPTGATKICAIILYDGISSAYIDDISITASDGSVLELPYSDFESKKPTAQPEVLFSDDFEQEGTIKDTWYKTSTVALTYETVTDNVYEGNKAAYLSGRNGIRSEAVSVLPGEVYTANANYITQSRYMRIYLEFWNGDPKLSTSTRQSSAYIDLPKSATWADGATTQLTVPSDCMYATVTLYFANENGSGYFDNVHLVRYEASGSYESMLDTENATDGNFAIKLTDNETTSGLISTLSGKDYKAAVDIKGEAELTLAFYDAQGNEMTSFTESGSGDTTVILDTTAPKNSYGARLTLKAVGETVFDNARIYPITESVSNYSFEVVPYTFAGKQLGYHWENFGDVAAKTISVDGLSDGALATELIGTGEIGGIHSSMIKVESGEKYSVRADIDGNANISIGFYDEELNFISKGNIAPEDAAFACVEITVNKGACAVVDNIEFSKAVIDIADRTQLFADDFMIAETDLERIVHEAEKTAPVLEANVDNEWETNGAYLYGSVLYDDKDGLYKMWYQSYNASYAEEGGDARSVMACYATSTDGIHWETPDLGIVEYNGNTSNNMLGNYHIQSVFIDEDAEESKRYKMFCYAHKYGKVYTSFYSADGINWTKEKDFVQGSDVMCVEYDEVNDRYFAVLKLGGGFGKRDQWTMRTDSEGNWYSPVMANTLADLLDARYCYRPDSYGMGIYERDGLYLGFNWAFRIPGTNIMEGTFAPQLTVSRDLSEEWRRVSHEEIVPLGEKGEIDDGMIVTASYPIEMGDEVWLYCGAWDNDHGLIDRNASAFIAKWRLDGFTSMSGSGSLTTKPVSFDGNALYLNANAENGSITVSLLDKNGDYIPGFEESDEITSDDVNSLVTWNGKSDLSSLANKEVVIKFNAENSDIYAFTFAKAPIITETDVEISVTFERDESSAPYNTAEYDNRARLYIYTDKDNSQAIETIILENGENSERSVKCALTLENGKYYAVIVKNGYIKHSFELDVYGEPLTIPEIKLVAGDIVASYDEMCGDGTVDIDDFVRVLRGFATDASDELRMRVDINEDGVVTVGDIALIKKNFGKSFDGE